MAERTTLLADVALPAVWTFHRGDEALTVARELTDGRLTLTIADANGPRSVEFDDLLALTLFQNDFERQLLENGWSLQGFAPEMRGGGDRRRTPRATPD